jgi:hypothetical protein
MHRILIAFIVSTLLLNVPAGAEELERTQDDWEGVYDRTGTTIKVGEWFAIGGGAASIGGLVFVVIGVRADSKGTELAGAAVATSGVVAFTAAPAIVAGAAIHQNAAVRQLNPSAPKAVWAYSSSALWAGAISTSVVGIRGGTVLLVGSYVTAWVQRSKNRSYWNSRTRSQADLHQPQRVQLVLTPAVFDGNRGLALTGRF